MSATMLAPEHDDGGRMSPDTVLYWPHHGEITAGQVVAILGAEQIPAESLPEHELRMLEDIVTRNIRRWQWEKHGAGQRDGRA